MYRILRVPKFRYADSLIPGSVRSNGIRYSLAPFFLKKKNGRGVSTARQSRKHANDTRSHVSDWCSSQEPLIVKAHT
eukprot:SAG31_NODE_1674_length_7560_cov_2.804852_7_plen_77_part_00